MLLASSARGRGVSPRSLSTGERETQRESSYRVRLMLGGVVVILVLFVLAGLSTGHVFLATAVDEVRQSVARANSYLELALHHYAAELESAPGHASNRLFTAGTAQLAYLVLTDEAGDEIYRSPAVDAMAEPAGQSIEAQILSGTVHVRSGLRLDDGRVFGLRFGLDTSSYRTIAGQLALQHAVLLAGSSAVALVLLYFVGRHWSRLTSRLRRLFRAVANGRPLQPAEGVVGSEFLRLSRAFDDMLEAIDARTAACSEIADRQHLVLDSANCMVALTDGDGRLVLANAPLLALNRLDEASAVGLHLRDLPAFSRDDSRAVLDQAFARGRDGARQVVALAFDTPQGERFGELHLQPVRDRAGAVEFLVGMLFDVTQHKQREQRLTERLAHWREVFDAAAYPITVLDENFRVTTANRAFSEWLGKPFDALVGRPCVACADDHDGHGRPCPHRAGLQEGNAVTAVTDGVGASGSFTVSTSPVHTADGRLAGAVCIAYDAAAAQQQEQQRLDALSRQRDTLIREVHHRIKNNLQGVIGLLRQATRRKAAAVDAINDAISQVHAIATVYGIQSRPDEQAPHLRTLLSAIAANAAASYPQISVSTDVDSCDPDTIIAEDKAVVIALIFNELLQNALKHSGGSDGGALVGLHCRREGDALRIVIRNTGALPENFCFAEGYGLGTGLELVRNMSPRSGFTLSIASAGAHVVATARLESPLVRIERSAS